MVEFARSLPRLRRAVRRDLALEGLPRDRVLACSVRLLDVGLFRVGGELYAEENGSYGLATLERRHVAIAGGELVFDYRAKSGQRRVQAVSDPSVRPVLLALMRRRSRDPRLLAYREGRTLWHDIRADDVNTYIKELVGPDASAKDFRTWHANVLAAVRLAGCGAVDGTRARERTIVETVREVAEQLGNTPAVCRSSYIDPRVFDCFRSGATIEVGPRAGLARVERSLVELLTN